jgi:uncharacterized membrane protein YhaH (DUF805 family)
MHDRSFLSGFEGRINRARYWLASLMILSAMIFSLLLLAVICITHDIPTGPLTIHLGGISASIKYTLKHPHDDAPAALFAHMAVLVITLGFGWRYAAASIKRLHDRNKSGWWIVPYIAAAGLYDQFGDWLGDSWPAVLVGYAVFVAFLWGVVEMGFLKGTNGPNRFGPDRLAQDTGARWDQQSELEFVAHSAGPSAFPHVMRGHD